MEVKKMKIAIIDTSEKTEARKLSCAIIADDYSKVQMAVLDDKALAHNVTTYKAQTINFKVDEATSAIVECCGILDRLRSKNGVVPCVILSELRSAVRLVGYIILSKNGSISRVRRDDVYRQCETARVRGVSFIQNGIYRDAEGVKSISCYPYRPFDVVVVGSTPKVVVRQPTEDKKVAKPKAEPVYTKAQLVELKSAEEKGVNTKYIKDPALSPEQMRILWKAQHNGRAVELFANPKYSPDTMRFFAKTVRERSMYKTHYDMFNADYDAEQVEELYYGISEGLDYSQYANPSMPAKRMSEKRSQLSNDFYKVLVEKHDKSVKRGSDDKASSYAFYESMAKTV